jgi:hypothetical protein
MSPEMYADDVAPSETSKKLIVQYCVPNGPVSPMVLVSLMAQSKRKRIEY